MANSQIFQMYHLNEMTLSAEFFLSCSVLQLTFYAVGTAYQRRQGFIILSQQVYSICFLILFFSVVILLNEKLFSVDIITGHHSVVNDYLSLTTKTTICFISAAFVLIVKLTYQDELIYNNFEYVVLITISVLGLMLLCSANDLITAYLSIELHSVAFYLMAAFNKNSSYSVESGLKYFITGALSSAFFLFGSAILYGCLGTFNFADFKIFSSLLTLVDVNQTSAIFSKTSSGDSEVLLKNYSFASNNISFILFDALESFNNSLIHEIVFFDANALNYKLIYLGLILIFVSIFIKLAIAPFHLWSLDVYEGSPNSTTIFFAVIPKIALFVLLIRLYYFSFYNQFNLDYQNYFLLFALLSVFVGSVGGLEQRKIKTLFAYSSISHTGYLFLSFGVNTAISLQLMLYYLIIFMISGLCFWAVYLFIKPKQDIYFRKHSKELADFVLLRDSNPMLALILTITLFSIAGIPPLIGFVAKIGIFLTVIQSSAYFIAVSAILFSITSTFYYIRFIKVLYFENVLVGKLYYPITTNKSLLLAVLALSLLVLSLDPTFFYLVFLKASLLITL